MRSSSPEEPGPIPAPRRGRLPWLRILVVILLAGIVGGGFVLIQVLRTPQTSPPVFTLPQQAGGMCPVNGAALNTSSGRPALNAVAAVSANDVWAVGSLASQALIEHWNGSLWSVVPGPAISTGGELNGISALAANDIWAVGGTYPEGAAQVRRGFTLHTLIEHWNGQQWSIVPSPDAVQVAQPAAGKPPQGLNRLMSIAAVSANNVWAVGSAEQSASGQSTLHSIPLVEHWDGSHWSIVPLPTIGGDATLKAVTAVSAGEVWAAGYSAPRGTFPPKPLFAHWDGHTWNFMQGPDTGFYGAEPAAISASAVNDVWAVGNKPGNTNPGPLLIEHWDGARWSLMPVPQLAEPAVLQGVLALAANNVWLVGGSPDYVSPPSPVVVEHWDGKKWDTLSQPRPTAGSLNGLSSVQGKIWAVGTSLIGLQAIPNTLIEKSC